MLLTLQKLGETFISTAFPSSAKLLLQNEKRPVKGKKLKEGDVINGYEIVEIAEGNNASATELYAVNMNRLKQELDELFGEEWWDFENKKAVQILKKYNIVKAEKIFSGTHVVTKLGIEAYYSGEPLKQLFVEFDVPEIDWSTVQKITTLTK